MTRFRWILKELGEMKNNSQKITYAMIPFYDILDKIIKGRLVVARIRDGGKEGRWMGVTIKG